MPLAQRSKGIDHGLTSEHGRIDQRNISDFGDWCEYGSLGYFFFAALLSGFVNGFHNVTMIIHNRAHHTLRDRQRRHAAQHRNGCVLLGISSFLGGGEVAHDERNGRSLGNHHTAPSRGKSNSPTNKVFALSRCRCSRSSLFGFRCRLGRSLVGINHALLLDLGAEHSRLGPHRLNGCAGGQDVFITQSNGGDRTHNFGTGRGRGEVHHLSSSDDSVGTGQGLVIGFGRRFVNIDGSREESTAPGRTSNGAR